MRRVGVFGGTFDPIHLGHIIVAEEVRVKLGLEQVVLVPAGRPWLKKHKEITLAEHRLTMAQLATEGRPHLTVSRIEVDRPGLSYTVDTIAAFSRIYDNEAELYFLLGSDALAELPRWKRPKKLLELCRLAVFSRPGFPVPSLDPIEMALPGVREKTVIVEVPQVDISATSIRKMVAEGASIGGLVPAPVELYILQHGLYRKFPAKGSSRARR